MQHSQYLGSIFRAKLGSSNPNSDIESSLVSSGLLGKNPNKLKITRRQQESNLKPQNNSPDIWRPKSKHKRLTTPASSVTSERNNTTPRRPSTAIIEHKTPPPLELPQAPEAPNVYFRNFILPTEPPTESNFYQLDEMIDRLNDAVNEDASHDDRFHIYNHVLSEVVRQYFVECTAQGEILEDCRQYFQQVRVEIPKISDTFERRIKALQSIITKTQNHMESYHPQIEANYNKSKHLMSVIAEMRQELQRLISHNDQLVKSIQVATNEGNEIKGNITQLDERIKKKNDDLINLNALLQTMSDTASQLTKDTVIYSENLKRLIDQKQNGRKLIDQLQIDISQKKSLVKRLDLEIHCLQEAIKESEAEIEKYDKDIQADLINRRIFRKAEKEQNKPISILEPRKAEGTLFHRIKVEYAKLTGKSVDEPLNIRTYEEFAKLEALCFEHEAEFHIGAEEIKIGEAGNFVLNENTSLDLIHLLAAKITSDAINRAVKKRPLDEKSTQTLAKQIMYHEVIDDVNKLRAKSKFIGLIKSDYSQREVQQFSWLIPVIRDLFHEKAKQDAKTLQEGSLFQSFPEFIYDYSREKFGLEFLADQFCWDIHITSHALKNLSTEVEMFVDFLDEKYDDEQLAFFLMCRSDCLKVGCSVQTRTRDQVEEFNEYYLSIDQVEELQPKWWKHRYNRKLYLRILDFSVPRPAIHLESTKRYVSMYDILYTTVLQYYEDTIQRLNEILLDNRLKPRLKTDQLTRLLLVLIPTLTSVQLNEFYRASVTRGRTRSVVTVNQFVKKFYDSSILIPPEIIENHDVADQELLESVSEEWARNNQMFTTILDFFKAQSSLQPDNLTLKNYLDDSLRFYSLLIHSLSGGDGRVASINYFQFITSLDIMFTTIGFIRPEYEEKSSVSLECCIRESWIDTVFVPQ